MKTYALITGGSDRIGKAVAIHLAKQGYHLVLHYNSAKDKAESAMPGRVPYRVVALPQPGTRRRSAGNCPLWC